MSKSCVCGYKNDSIIPQMFISSLSVAKTSTFSKYVHVFWGVHETYLLTCGYIRPRFDIKMLLR